MPEFYDTDAMVCQIYCTFIRLAARADCPPKPRREKMKDVLVTLRGAMKMFGNKDIFEVQSDDSLILNEEEDSD